MNKFKLSILSLGVVSGLSLASCADSFLDVESMTSSNTENFYKTESDAWRALIGCYDGWRQVSSDGNAISFYVASTVMSDETFGGTGNGDSRGYQVIDRFDQSQSPSDVQLYSYTWKEYYAGVYRCNELITRDANIAWKDEAKHGLYIGECRALRAIMYFDMIRLWGNIPLFLEPSQDNREQANPDEVYAAIFSDLQYAIENIPASANRASDELGRITKAAAEGILARAYLFYTGYYGKDSFSYTDSEGNTTSVTKADALAAVEDIINSQNYSLVPDFKNLWPAASLVPIADKVGWDASSTYAGDWNSEVILAQNFTPTQDYDGNNDSNRWLVMMGMRSLNASPYGKGWGACTVCPTYLQRFASSDTRLSASVIDLSGEGIASGADYESSVSDWREYTGYTVKKYTPLCYGNGLPGTNADGTAGFQECNPQQWVLLRYADVLLMAAELGSSNGRTYLNMVRSRAGLDNVTLSQQNIMDERARELAFEGIRYWDLLRQGVSVLADAITASAGTVKNGGVSGTVTFDRSKIIATNGLSQIPADQITLSNGVLKQNAGW